MSINWSEMAPFMAITTVNKKRSEAIYLHVFCFVEPAGHQEVISPFKAKVFQAAVSSDMLTQKC